MITVGRLKELLSKIPDGERLYAYEGEDTGIVIGNSFAENSWFIAASADEEEDTETEGFE